MKIQLDTTNKIIKIEESVNLGDFINNLELLLPYGKWREFKIETSTILNWTNPIIIEPYIPYVPTTPSPTPYYLQPWIVTCNNGDVYSLNSGTYNVDLK